MYWITNWYNKYERSKIKIEMQKQHLIPLIASTLARTKVFADISTSFLFAKLEV
jgi:hypothetical protein